MADVIIETQLFIVAVGFNGNDNIIDRGKAMKK